MFYHVVLMTFSPTADQSFHNEVERYCEQVPENPQRAAPISVIVIPRANLLTTVPPTILTTLSPPFKTS